MDRGRKRFPAWSFDRASLPELAGIPAAAYRHVVSETSCRIAAAVAGVRRLPAQEGALYLSWRVGSGQDARDAAGRLDSAFLVETVRAALQGLQCLRDA